MRDIGTLLLITVWITSLFGAHFLGFAARGQIDRQEHPECFPQIMEPSTSEPPEPTEGEGND